MLQGSALPNLEDLIVALASAPGAALRAVIRLSGRKAAETLASVWKPSPDSGATALSTRWTQGEFLPIGWQDTEAIPAMARMWKHGTGYTGQEAAEVHCLGAVPCVEAVINTLNRLGARGAGPGEFTLRAFLAGRVDLVRAEALLGLTHAATAEQLADALDQHAGGISDPMARLREDLLDYLADIEAGLDFADEDLAQLPTAESLNRVSRLLAQAMLIAKKMQGRGHLTSVFRVALVGLPNAGKSTLFNRLAGLADDQAALVSTRPGTTRDWLSHKSRLPGGTSVEWIDTAGWQSASNTIEEQAQSLGRAESEKADLVLICQPVDCEAFSPYSDFVFQSNSQALQLFTCADRPPNPAILGHENAIWVSGLTGAGVAELLEKVEVEAKARGAKVVAPHLARGKEHVEKLVQHLRAAHSLILEEDPIELVAFEVRAAVDELGAVLGNIYSDDLLGRVFSRFCIGK